MSWLALICLMAFSILGGLRARKYPPPKIKTWQSGVAFAVFFITLVSLPIVGAEIAVNLGLGFSWRAAVSFGWIAVVASLPLALLTARLFGEKALADFWEYLLDENGFPAGPKTKRGTILRFAAFCVGFFIYGMINLALLLRDGPSEL